MTGKQREEQRDDDGEDESSSTAPPIKNINLEITVQPGPAFSASVNFGLGPLSVTPSCGAVTSVVGHTSDTCSVTPPVSFGYPSPPRACVPSVSLPL